MIYRQIYAPTLTSAAQLVNLPRLLLRGRQMAELPVSIAMATYNGARYIGEQLDDLARQTQPPAELVVSDDSSSDGTLAIVERFASKAPFPVRIHSNPRRLGYREN